MSFGSSFDENAFQLDGVNVTDNYFSEGFSEPNPDAIDEVEVLSLGAPAEYGNLMGAVYNIVTKQGTNQFHGDASYFFQSNGLTSNNTTDVKFPNGKFADACADDPAARCPWTRGDYFEGVGAARRPDCEGQTLVLRVVWTSEGRSSRRVGVNSNASRQRDRHHERSGARERDLADVRRASGSSATSICDKSPQGHRLQLQRDAVDGMDAHADGADAGRGVHGDALEQNVAGRSLLGVLRRRDRVSVGSESTAQSQPRILQRRDRHDQRRQLLLVPLRRQPDHRHRRSCRTMPTGSWAPSRTSTSACSTTRPACRACTATTISSTRICPAASRTGTATCASTFSYAAQARNIGAFVDDSVRLGDRVTLNLGVRADHSNGVCAGAEELDDNAQPTGKTFPRADFFTWNSISPRLGVNFKLTGDGKTVVKSHWGRYHPQITTGEFANVIGPNVKPYYQGTYNSATGQIEDLFLTSSSENLSVASNYSPPRTDQFILGVRAGAEREDGPAGELRAQVGTRFRRLARHRRHLRSGADRRQLGTGSRPVARSTSSGLTSDPGARKFELGNSDDLFTDIHAVTAEPDQAHDPLVCQRERHLSAIDGSARRKPAQHDHSAAERPGVQHVRPQPQRFRQSRWAPRRRRRLAGQGAGRREASAGLSGVGEPRRPRRRHIRSGREPFRQSVAGQPSTTILLQPRGDLGRLADVTIIDARLQKDFALGRGARLSLFMDALNLNNENAPQGVVSANVTSPQLSVPDDFRRAAPAHAERKVQFLG